MNNDDHPLRFNRAKHDEKVSAKKSGDIERIKAEILGKMARAYDQQLATMVRKAKRAKTHAQVMAAIGEFIGTLRALVTTHATHPALHEWTAFTLALLGDKEEELRLTEWDQRNCFIAWAPELAGESALHPAMRSPVIRYTFATQEEFNALAAVQKARAWNGFVGFVLDGNLIVAFNEEGEPQPVGRVTNGIAVQHLPSLTQYQEALKKNRGGKK